MGLQEQSSNSAGLTEFDGSDELQEGDSKLCLVCNSETTVSCGTVQYCGSCGREFSMNTDSRSPFPSM